MTKKEKEIRKWIKSGDWKYQEIISNAEKHRESFRTDDEKIYEGRIENAPEDIKLENAVKYYVYSELN